MDIFNEWIVKRKNDIKDKIINVSSVLIGIILINIVFIFGRYLGPFGFVVVAGIVYGLFYLIKSRNIEFEYSVTNGELDIDKIISKSKRKRVINVHSRTFEYFAPVTKAHESAFKVDATVKKIDASSNTANDKLYFAIFYKNNEKTLLIFEPTEKMIDDFSRYVPRSMFFKI